MGLVHPLSAGLSVKCRGGDRGCEGLLKGLSQFALPQSHVLTVAVGCSRYVRSPSWHAEPKRRLDTGDPAPRVLAMLATRHTFYNVQWAVPQCCPTVATSFEKKKGLFDYQLIQRPCAPRVRRSIYTFRISMLAKVESRRSVLSVPAFIEHLRPLSSANTLASEHVKGSGVPRRTFELNLDGVT